MIFEDLLGGPVEDGFTGGKEPEPAVIGCDGSVLATCNSILVSRIFAHCVNAILKMEEAWTCGDLYQAADEALSSFEE